MGLLTNDRCLGSEQFNPNTSKPATLSLVASAATERTTMEPGPETTDTLVKLTSKRERKEAEEKSERDKLKQERRQKQAQAASERKQRENEKAAAERSKAVLRASASTTLEKTDPVVLPVPVVVEAPASVTVDSWPASRVPSRDGSQQDQADFDDDHAIAIDAYAKCALSTDALSPQEAWERSQPKSEGRTCAEASDQCQTGSEAKLVPSVKQGAGDGTSEFGSSAEVKYFQSKTFKIDPDEWKPNVPQQYWPTIVEPNWEFNDHVGEKEIVDSLKYWLAETDEEITEGLLQIPEIWVLARLNDRDRDTAMSLMPNKQSAELLPENILKKLTMELVESAFALQPNRTTMSTPYLKMPDSFSTTKLDEFFMTEAMQNLRPLNTRQRHYVRKEVQMIFDSDMELCEKDEAITKLLLFPAECVLLYDELRVPPQSIVRLAKMRAAFQKDTSRKAFRGENPVRERAEREAWH